MSLKTFRAQYSASQSDDPNAKNSLLSILLVRSAAHLKNVFLDAARAAGNNNRDSNNTASAIDGNNNNNEDDHPSPTQRRPSGCPPCRRGGLAYQKMSSVTEGHSASSIRFATCERREMPTRLPLLTHRAEQTTTRLMAASKICLPLIHIMKMAPIWTRSITCRTRAECASRNVRKEAVTPRIITASLDSSKNHRSRRSLELAGKLPRPGRDGSVIRMPSYHRKKRRSHGNGHGNNDNSNNTLGDQSFTMDGSGRAEHMSIENGRKFHGVQLGVGNRDIFAGMHIYHRLMSKELLPSIKDRCDVIEDLHKMVEPLLAGSAAEQHNVNAEALRCIVANAFLAHGGPIYKALLALVFRPAPSSQRTEKVMRQLSLNPEFQGCRAESGDDHLNMQRGLRRYRTNDIAFNILDSMSHMQLNGMRNQDNGNLNQQPAGEEDDRHANICLPNPECDTDTAYKCTAMLLLFSAQSNRFYYSMHHYQIRQRRHWELLVTTSNNLIASRKLA